MRRRLTDGEPLSDLARDAPQHGWVVQIGKWVAISVAMAIFLLWLATLWLSIIYRHRPVTIYMVRGRVLLTWEVGDPFEIARTIHADAWMETNGWHLYRFRGLVPSMDRLGFAMPEWDVRPPPSPAWRTTLSSISCPLWILEAAALGLCILFLRISRRRIPAGNCKTCAYDLTGNISGKCPECGTPLMRPISREAAKPASSGDANDRNSAGPA